jgi:S1-C subfamily serine protease
MFGRYMGTICLAILAVCVSPQEGWDQITTNVFRRVLMVQAGKTSGTSFTIEVDGRQYLITAKHVVAGLKADDTIRIRRGDNWESLKVKVLRCDDPIDIAVLVPPKQITVTFPLEPTLDRIRLGQDMYFAGFPYGISSSAAKNINDLYPLAFIKKGILSASTNEKGAVTIYIDGHNNPGFSGGPIVYRDFDQSDVVYKIAAVVSGFRFEVSPVFQREPISSDQIKPEDIAKARVIEENGRLFRLNDTDMVVRLNTGIVIGHSISHAVELIRKNPIGPEISDDH